MLSPQQVQKKVLRSIMRQYDLGLDVPEENLAASEFLEETTIYFSEIFLNAAVIDTTDPFEDEVIAGGLLSIAVAALLGRAFDEPFEAVAKQAFRGIYCYAYRDNPADRDKAWFVTKSLCERLAEKTPVMDDLYSKVADFLIDPCADNLTNVANSIEALREALDHD